MKEHRRRRIIPVDKETLSSLRDYISRGGPVRRDGQKLVFGISRHEKGIMVTPRKDVQPPTVPEKEPPGDALPGGLFRGKRRRKGVHLRQLQVAKCYAKWQLRTLFECKLGNYEILF
jgi:hypothetical protein